MKVKEIHGGSRPSTVMDGIRGAWTDEMHSSYLNQMEACFVRRMWCSRWLDRQRLRQRVDFGTSPEVTAQPPPPLNRYVPDGESTSGSRKCRRSGNKAHEDDHKELSTSTRRNKLVKRVLHPIHDEQVVPVFGSMRAEDNYKAREQLDSA